MNRGRRSLLLGGTALPWLGACGRAEPEAIGQGGWVGAGVERGHRLRAGAQRTGPAPDVQRRAGVLVLGAGIAGLSAARALRGHGIDDVQVLELEDQAGGNSRGHHIAGMACPLGAHYLPLPGAQAGEVAQWLEEIGLARQEHGRVVYDERHLCHSPQERLFFDGAWHEGLLPPAAPGSRTQAQYQQFAEAVAAAQRSLGFAMPTHRAPWSAGHAALDGLEFDAWLTQQGLDDTNLRTYLDYCCRDDYGAGIDTVSAWAGLHYFASRHGFVAPGDADDPADAVLTWPEGNAWLTRRLAEPLGDRLHTGCVVERVSAARHEVSVDLWRAAAQRSERWVAAQVVIALPLFIAARLLDPAPAALAEAVAQLRYAPWLVANLHLAEPLLDRPGAAPAWDNVIHGSAGLGYVDAMHQSTRPFAGPTVLTAYRALPVAERAVLLGEPWQAWAQRVVNELAVVHPDLPRKLKRADLMRYGHAMSIPVPGVRGSAALRALGEPAAGARLHFAHADLSGYSVFEEAFTWGARVGERVARVFRNS